MKRSKALEKATADYLDIVRIPYIRIENYRCFKCGQAQNSHAAGFPDFMLLGNYFGTAVECKTGAGRLSAKQKEVRGNWGGEYLIVRDNIDILIDFLKG